MCGADYSEIMAARCSEAEGILRSASLAAKGAPSAQATYRTSYLLPPKPPEYPIFDGRPEQREEVLLGWDLPEQRDG